MPASGRSVSDQDEDDDDEDAVAVVGLAARYPGATDPDAFWRNLAAGQCAIAEVPAARWDLRDRFEPGRGAAGTTRSKWAALLDRVDTFDERFFRLSPLDAQAMDPQQRLFLEEAWHALEDAGYAADLTGPGRPWGVFVGCGAGDYADLLAGAGQNLTGQAFLGNAPSVLPARIAYLLNMTGPTMAVDTACSSSLVAVHLAAAAVRRGECELALAGGVAVMSTEKMQVWTSQAGMLSPRGQCRPFDASADGIVLGEGVGIVVLKRLSRALADGDTIHGVVRGSGINGDGKSNGITAPSGTAQAQLLRAVYDRSGVTPADITYVETHGTGTRLGDPIEVGALNTVYGAAGDGPGTRGLGSVKGNIGHTTMAAGVAGLIKVLLALRHGQLPPSGGYTGAPNDEIDFDAGPFRVVTELRSWPPGASGQRIAAVSSFGFSGTNCHLVVSEPPQPGKCPPAEGPELVLLSARTADELRTVASRLADRLRNEPPRLDDLAFTLAAGRPALHQRAAFVATGPAELLAALDGWQPAGEEEQAAPEGATPDPAPGELMARARDSRSASDLHRVADAFRAGAAADWGELFAGRALRRIPLPTYPFAPRSHWVEAQAERGPARAGQARRETIDAGSPLARGHRVAGRTVLPAAASISLFAAAARDHDQRQAVVLDDIRWLRPVLLDDAAGTEVEVTADAGGQLTLTAAGQVSATARTAGAAAGGVPQSADLAQVVAACPHEADIEGLYRDFAASGLEYDGDFRALAALRTGDGVAMATLRPVAAPAGGKSAGWPPAAVLDGAIQAAAALTTDEGQLLPFSADRVEVPGTDATPRYSIVHARGPRRFDVDVVADDGRVCVAVRGLMLRAAAAGHRPMVFRPLWADTGPSVQAGQPPGEEAAGRVAVVGDAGDSLAQALLASAAHGGVLVQPGDLRPLTGAEDRLPDTIYWVGAPQQAPGTPGAATAPAREVFALLKYLSGAAGRSTPLRLVGVTRQAFAVHDGETAVPEQAAAVGLLRAAAAEYPAWEVRIVDAGPGEPSAVAADVAQLASDDAGTSEPLVALRGGRRLARRLVPDRPRELARGPWAAGGCYLLLGGSGGIGIQLARHLAQTAGARIALVGRRPEDPRLAGIVADIERRGGQAGYWQADASDATGMRRVVEAVVRRFGPISTAVHCALQLRDRSLATMTDADLREVFAPKIDGSLNLVQALDGQPLDRLIFFSSALSFTDAPGQGNYAAASHFEDAYAAALRARGLPAAVVNWGFWGTVGAVATPGQRRRFAQLGIEPIEPEEGLRALEAALSAGHGQSVIVKGTPAGLARLGADGASPAPGSGAAAESLVAVPTAEPEPDPADGFDQLEEFARAFAASVVRPLIDDVLRGATATADELAGQAGVEPRQRGLFDAVLAILEREGVVRWAGERMTVLGPNGLADRVARLERELLAARPALRPHAELIRTCVRALPDVLSGRASGLDVLFPGGSAAQVEAVYAGNSAADHYHRLLARSLADHARSVTDREQRQARILEVGAGTGSSTRFVLPACADLPEPPELMITDISRAFVTRAREEFAAGHEWVSCADFDVERPPGDQGLAPGTFDAVYATNVIHATADVTAALGNAAALLRPGGLVLINEITQPSDFATLTFGLTTGWWRFRDAYRRLPHGPLLDVRHWEEACRAAGLDVIDRFGLPSAGDDRAARQCVLVARLPETAVPLPTGVRPETAVQPEAAVQPDPDAGAAGPHPAPADTDLARPVLTYLRGIFADVLKFDESELDQNANFDVFGIDSLVALNLIDRLQEDLGPLPSTLLFEHLTLRALADHLAGTHRAELLRVTGTTAAPPPAQPTSAQPAPAEPALAEGAPPSATQHARRGGVSPESPQDASAIAVVGMVGRYPGSPDLESFWQNLRDGRSCVRDVPAERWDWRDYFDERRAVPDRTYSRRGGFLDGVDLFDPGFFGILPKDAIAMDPQERLFLEASWTLLQQAGCLGRRREPRTGVFVGTMYGSYGQIAAANGWPGGHFGDGHSAYWAIANRVSYTFDFRGPSMAVDSACSSSATAVHLACESLRRGESSMAIAGGVNLILHPAHFIALSQLGMLSARGQCRVFDEAADGFVPGEGVGAVLLKPLPAAEADGDDIWAVIRGGLANAGGKTSGFTVPNPGAQAELIAETLRRSGLAAGDIGYVEAHGTGTALGDPIEIAALGRALGEAGGTGGCVVGSVKSMIGHLEGASGIAGLTKAVLQLRHQTLVPQPGFDRLNPKIDLDTAALRVPTEATRWETSGVRRAGLSSFGAGGANVHLVLEEYPRPAASDQVPDHPSLVLLSARDRGQLLSMARDLEQWITGGRIGSIAGLAFTSQVGRAEFPFRLGVLGADLDAVSHALRAFQAGEPGDWLAGQARAGDADLLDDADGSAFIDAQLAKRNWRKLARLWVEGTDIDWRRAWQQPRPRVTMPPYPWDRRRFWLPERSQLPVRPAGPRRQVVRLPSALAGQHLVNGQRWAPAAILLDAVEQAAEQAAGHPGGVELRNVRLLAPLDRDGGEVAVDLEPGEDTTAFALRDTPEGRVIATGELAGAAGGEQERIDLAALRERCPAQRTPDDVYAALRGGGLEHGPALRVLREIAVGDGEVLAKVIPAGTAAPGLIPAAVLDGAFQALALLPGSQPCVPSGLGAVRGLSSAGSCSWITARELPAAGGRRRFDIALADESGAVLTLVEGLETAPLPAAQDAATQDGTATPDGAAAEEHGAVVRLLQPAWTGQERITGAEPPRRVLVLAEDEVGPALVQELQAAGASAILAPRGGEFPARPGEPASGLRYDRENLGRLIEELRAEGAEPDAVVQWIGTPGGDDTDGRTQRELDAGLWPLLWTAGALLGRRRGGTLRIVAGYRGDAARPAIAGLGGALRSLALESSGLRGTLAEFAGTAGTDPAAIARELCAELTSTMPGDTRVQEIRLDGGRQARTVQPAGLDPGGPQAAPPASLPAGVWLVTGGAGRIGRHLAAHLASRPGNSVILAGRRPLGDPEREELGALAGPGSAVRYEQADVSDAEQARALVQGIRAAYGPVTAVVHAAGVHHDALVAAKTDEQIEDVLAPKVGGIERLDAALAGEPLELVVLFSSLAGWTGNLGQADYAFANAYLDAYALRREALRQAGRCRGRTVSIGWPLWAEGGMTVDDATAELHARLFRSAPLPTPAALAVFDRIAAAGTGCVFVSSQAPDSPGRPSPSPDSPHVPEHRQEPAAARQAAAPASPADLAAAVEDTLRGIAAEFLLVEPRHVDMTADLLDTGFDSISLTKLVNVLNERFDLALLPTVLFERVNLADFAAYLAEEHGDSFPPPAAQQPAAQQQAAQQQAPEQPARPPAVTASPRPAAPPPAPAPRSETALAPAPAPAPETAPEAGRETAAEVAIVGLAALMPGCHDLDEFWTHLASGTSLIGPPPADRSDIRQDPATAGVRGGFLTEKVRRFDAALFGISPREATMMDPQQRLFLEAVWRAIEDAGYPPGALAGTATGLFVGVSACDYDDLLREHGVPVQAHTASGVASCILANRVSHHFDLRGPSEAIDTACSSSLVALHHAVRSIQAGECDQAIVGGVNLLLSPGLFEAFTKSGMLSPDGRCKAFDESADGYGRGEGVGVILLKRARAAQAASDRIYAIVRGSAVNHGGHANSLTAPNPRAQAEVIAAAYRDAGIDPATISYVEAHGTGTPLGDPVEIEGLRRAFAEFGVTTGDTAIGTVKNAVGHLEAAAGIAGVIKVLLCGQHGQLPPHGGFETANPYLRLDESPFRIDSELRDWAGVTDGHGGTVRRAAVSSFGFGGTNAHVVLDAVAAAGAPPAAATGPYALPLSAPTAAALREYASRMADHLAGAATDAELAHVAYTLQVARAGLEHRACVLADDAATAERLLRAAADGESGDLIWSGRAARSARPAPDADAAIQDAPDGPGALAELCAAWAAGAKVNWAKRWPGPASRARIPSFPFADTEFWFDDAASPRTDDAAPPSQEVTMPEQRRPGPAASTTAVAPKIVLAAPHRGSAPAPANGASGNSGTVAAAPAPVQPAPAAEIPAAPRSEAPAAPSAPPSGTVRSGPPSSSAPAIRSMLAAVLGCGENDVDDDAPFGELGLDSIFRMELVRHLTTSYELSLKSEQLYEYDSVSALARFIDNLGTASHARPDSASDSSDDSDGPRGAASPGGPGSPQDGPDSPQDGPDSPPDEPDSPPDEPDSPPDEPDSPPEMREMLEKLLADVTDGDFDDSQSFADSGVTSFQMLRLVSSLESTLGPLPKTLLFDYPTLDQLAAELTERYGSAVSRPEPEASGRAPAGSGRAPVPADAPMPTCHLKRTLADEPGIAGVVDRLHAAYGKEDGLAGRDIAPQILLGQEQEGYFHVGIGRGALLAWNYTGSEEYFPRLAAQLMTYARAHGLRPNFLSLRCLDTVGGEPVTATPLGAVQRIEKLTEFTLATSKMSRLRYMLRRFERGAEVRVEEYSAGSDQETDAKLAGLVDSWTHNKAMVNPYVTIVREEIRTGRLAERHRVFLTYRNGEIVNAIVITRMGSENGYLLDVEFYPPDAPLGGLETAIVLIIEKLQAEGDTVFSFGASFGVRIASCDNAAPEIEHGLEELRSVGIFGEGNFKFKNKFRPVNIPIYLCQPADEPRTSLADVILLISSPDLVSAGTPPAAGGQPADTAPVTPRPVAAEHSPASQADPGATAPAHDAEAPAHDAEAPAHDAEAPAHHGPAAAPDAAAPAREGQAGWRQLLSAHGYNPLAIPHDDAPVDLGTDSWAELDGPQIRERSAQLDAAAGAATLTPPPWLPFRHVTITGSGKTATAMLCRSLRRRGSVPRNTVLHNAVFPTWMPPLIEGGFDPADISRPGSPGEWDDEHVGERLADPGTIAVCIELATNSGGGVAVPAGRLRTLRRLASAQGVPVILDATRVIDNVLAADGAADPWSAVSELLALGDLVMMSLTKDFGVPAGGLVATNDDSLARTIAAEARARGPELPLIARKQVHAALADTARVAGMVRQRGQAVRALWEPLHAAGLPVPDAPGGHCVLLDTARLDACQGFENPQLACLSWIFEHAGVRGAPHLAPDGPLAAAVRFAVPLGMTPADAARAGTAIAAALARPDGPVDLIAVPDGSDLGAAAFHPRAAVPDDVADALHERNDTTDENAAVLAESCPGVRRMLLPRPGGDVEVFVAGHGPAVVLLPPFNIGAGVFARQFSGLTGQARLIAVHHPGLGASTGADDLTLDGLADLIAGVLDELGETGPAHLCGASFGGLPALTFALRYPQRTRSLTLLGSSFKIGNRVGEVNRLQVVAREDFDAVIAGSGSDRVAAGRAGWERTLLRCESMDGRTGLRYLDVFAARPDLRARLPEISVPTLVVHGRHDTVIPLKTAHLLHGLVPDAEYVEVPDAGHFPGLTEPDVVNTAMAGLLRRASGQDPALARPEAAGQGASPRETVTAGQS
jgi:acyl transferase domain-containing protein/pimeloyl-ACP methyl ester carboxylesterase/acyl carrier protein/SAM-dependent methyltransferase